MASPKYISIKMKFKLYPYKSLTPNMGIVINAQVSLTIQLISTWELKEG